MREDREEMWVGYVLAQDLEKAVKAVADCSGYPEQPERHRED